MGRRTGDGGVIKSGREINEGRGEGKPKELLFAVLGPLLNSHNDQVPVSAK